MLAVFGYVLLLRDAPAALFCSDLIESPQARRASSDTVQGFVCAAGAIPDELQRGHRLGTLVTAVFVHTGWLHLVSNVLFLVGFAPRVEEDLGRAGLLALFFGTAVLGGVVHVGIVPDLTQPSIGASGGVAGVLGAHLLLARGAEVRVLVGPVPLRLPTSFVLGLWALLQVVYTTIALQRAEYPGGVSYEVHVVGFAAGVAVVAVALLVRPDLRQWRPPTPVSPLPRVQVATGAREAEDDRVSVSLALPRAATSIALPRPTWPGVAWPVLRWTPSRRAVVVTVLASSFVAMVAGAAPAGAHTALAGTVPADGAVLAQAPSEVVVSFTGDVLADFAEVVVIDGDGRAVAVEASRTDARVLTRPLPVDLGPGSYSVRFRVVSADGHPVTGESTFAVEAAASGPVPPPAAATDAAPAAPPSTSTDTAPAAPPSATPGTELPLLPVGVTGLLLLATAAVFRFRRRRSSGTGAGVAA